MLVKQNTIVPWPQNKPMFSCIMEVCSSYAASAGALHDTHRFLELDPTSGKVPLRHHFGSSEEEISHQFPMTEKEKEGGVSNCQERKRKKKEDGGDNRMKE